MPFGRADYAAMADQMGAIAGSSVLSINATPFVRETFAAHDVQEISATRTPSTARVGAGQHANDLLSATYRVGT